MGKTKTIKCPRTFLPKQREVLDAVKKHNYILYSGAYGAGKTFLCCHVIIRSCIKHNNVLAMYGAQTVPMLRDTVIRTFLEEIDVYQESLNKQNVGINLKKSWNKSTNTFTFFNDSEVLFRSCNQPSKLKSLNLDCFALDEPVDIDEDIFLMLTGRLRANHMGHRYGIMAGNPAGKTNWVYTRFFDNEDPRYYAVHTTSYDNKHLPNDYIRNMESNYDEDYKRRYLYGEWGSFEGQVFKNFDIEKDVIDLSDKKRKDFKFILGGYDDGYRNPACLLTIGVDNDHNTYILDEYYMSQRTSDEIVQDIYPIYDKWGHKRIYCDPSALNFIETAKNENLPVYLGDNDIEKGVSLIKSMFNADKIKIDRKCENTIREFESYRYGKDSYTKNRNEKPVKKDDHTPDSFRYAMTNFNPFRKDSSLGAVTFSRG